MRTFNKVWPIEVLHTRLLNDWTSRSETSAHWRDNQGKILRGDVAAWWPSGKPQQQPEQCGQLPPKNEMVLSGKMCRVINSFDLCKLPQLHRSAKGWNVYSAQNAFCFLARSALPLPEITLLEASQAAPARRATAQVGFSSG